jgi:hypothetical protein
MAKIKFLCQVGLLSLCLLCILPVKAESLNPFGQTLQISTHLSALVGKPTWLIMLRNVDTGEVLPYLYDVREYDNFWIALSFGRSYRIEASNMQWGSNIVIRNFCHLEGGVFTNKSFIITLSGKLSPNQNLSHCDVIKYKEYSLPVVNYDTNN